MDGIVTKPRSEGILTSRPVTIRYAIIRRRSLVNVDVQSGVHLV